MNIKRLERLIESLEEFKNFQQALRAERDAREAYQMLAAVEATRPVDRQATTELTRAVDQPRLIDDLLLDRLRPPPPGRPVNLRAIPVLPTPRVRPPTRTRLPPAPIAA